MTSLTLGSVIQVLNFLLNLYKLRQEQQAKPQENDPDPEALKEVITELEKGPPGEDAEQSVAAQLDQRLNPAQAQRVKEDLSVARVIALSPDLSKRDYWTVLCQYAEALQALAIRFEVFRIFGVRLDNVGRVALPNTGAALLPRIIVQERALEIPTGRAAGIVVQVNAELVDSAEDFPIFPIVGGRWVGRSYGYGSSEPSLDAIARYTIQVGQDRNWLRFTPRSSDYNFRPLQRRLDAEDMKTIMAVMKQEVFDYVKRIEAENTTLEEIHSELSDLLDKRDKNRT